MAAPSNRLLWCRFFEKTQVLKPVDVAAVCSLCAM
jgi:hypothetical protein